MSFNPSLLRWTLLTCQSDLAAVMSDPITEPRSSPLPLWFFKCSMWQETGLVFLLRLQPPTWQRQGPEIRAASQTHWPGDVLLFFLPERLQREVAAFLSAESPGRGMPVCQSVGLHAWEGKAVTPAGHPCLSLHSSLLLT